MIFLRCCSSELLRVYLALDQTPVCFQSNDTNWMQHLFSINDDDAWYQADSGISKRTDHIDSNSDPGKCSENLNNVIGLNGTLLEFVEANQFFVTPNLHTSRGWSWFEERCGRKIGTTRRSLHAFSKTIPAMGVCCDVNARHVCARCFRKVERAIKSSSSSRTCRRGSRNLVERGWKLSCEIIPFEDPGCPINN
jgi:hypothetical protein